MSAIAALTTASAAIAAVVGWTQLGGPLPALTSDIQVVQSKIDAINKRIDGIDLLNLYRELERVEDKLDALNAKQERETNPAVRAARQENIRTQERRLKDINRQIDALQ